MLFVWRPRSKYLWGERPTRLDLTDDMGEAKAKRNRLKASTCRCRSKRLAADCCFGGAFWHKPPVHLGLRMLPPETSHDRCYMRELQNCEGPISGEHLISQTVIEVLRGEADFTVSGLPWQGAGEEKRLAPGNLTANCLCRRHNSALSPLDSAAGLPDCVSAWRRRLRLRHICFPATTSKGGYSRR
jgi:hypothetical protein